MFSTILLAIDGSDGTAHVVEHALAIARKFGARIHAIYALEVPALTADHGQMAPNVQGITESMRTFGNDLLERTLQGMKDDGFTAVQGQVVEGHPAEAILHYAQEVGIDLIVVGTHGRRGWQRLVLGSVAAEVVRTSPVPVMTVHIGRSGANDA